MANLTMTNWHIQDKTPYIKLGSSGENNASSINITVDELVEGATYYLDIGDANDSGLPNTQEMTPYAYTNAENENIYVLQMKPLRSWLGHDGIKLLQVRCVYTEDDEEVCKQSNVIHGIVTKNTGFVYQYSIAIFEQYIQKIKELVANLPITLSKLKDVAIDTPTDGQVLKYDGNAQKWVNGEGGGSGGTSDYNALNNLPSINSVTLSGNKTSADLGIESNLILNTTPIVGEVEDAVYIDKTPQEPPTTVGVVYCSNSLLAEDSFNSIFNPWCNITTTHDDATNMDEHLYTPPTDVSIELKLPDSSDYVYMVSIRQYYEKVGWLTAMAYDVTYYIDDPSSTSMYQKRQVVSSDILFSGVKFTYISNNSNLMIGNSVNQTLEKYTLTNNSLVTINRVDLKDNATKEVTLDLNKYYIFTDSTDTKGYVEELSISLNNDNLQWKYEVPDYHFAFMSGDTPTQLILPNDVGIPEELTINAQTYYDIYINPYTYTVRYGSRSL